MKTLKTGLFAVVMLVCSTILLEAACTTAPEAAAARSDAIMVGIQALASKSDALMAYTEADTEADAAIAMYALYTDPIHCNDNTNIANVDQEGVLGGDDMASGAIELVEADGYLTQGAAHINAGDVHVVKSEFAEACDEFAEAESDYAKAKFHYDLSEEHFNDGFDHFYNAIMYMCTDCFMLCMGV